MIEPFHDPRRVPLLVVPLAHEAVHHRQDPREQGGHDDDDEARDVPRGVLFSEDQGSDEVAFGVNES